MESPIRAVLFDLDGTLVDSLPDLTGAVNRMLAAEGRAMLPAGAVREMVGDGAGTLVERAFAARGGLPGPSVEPYLARFLADYEPHSADDTVVWPGVMEALDELRAAGLTLAVCTNKPSAATAFVLGRLGLADFFELVVGGDDAPALKPDPAHLRVILERLSLAPHQAVMVGDSPNDIVAARAARVPSVAVSFGYSPVAAALLGADVVIDAFGDLPAAIGRLGMAAAVGRLGATLAVGP